MKALKKALFLILYLGVQNKSQFKMSDNPMSNNYMGK